MIKIQLCIHLFLGNQLNMMEIIFRHTKTKFRKKCEKKVSKEKKKIADAENNLSK